MLDKLIGGFGNGYGHKDHISSGYGFEEHKEYVSHMETKGGYVDRQARYDHHMRLPTNHSRPPMAHMPVCDEEDSEEFFKSSRSHHTTVSPHHGKNHHHQQPHMNFLAPAPMSQPHHNGKMGNGWQGSHENAYHGGHGMQHQGEHGMKHHGEHGMQHHGEHGMKHHGEQHGMKHHSEHGMKHHGEQHGMKHHSEHGMQHHGVHGMKHQDRLMAPQIPAHNVYMNPSHGPGSGPAVVVKASENWRVSNRVGGKHMGGWGSKGL